MMELRPATIADIFDQTSVPSEESITEICTLLAECGFSVRAVSDDWDSTAIEIVSDVPSISGRLRLDRQDESFALSLEHGGRTRRLVTRSDNRLFRFLLEQMEPLVGVITEEVNVVTKWNNLGPSAQELLTALVNTYIAEGTFSFPIDGAGMDPGITDELLTQGFIRIAGRSAVVLDMTLADNLRYHNLA